MPHLFGEATTFLRVSVTLFDTENVYDYLTIGGTRYSGTNGPSAVLMNKGDEMQWYTDGSVVRQGFVVCARPQYHLLYQGSPACSEHISTMAECAEAASDVGLSDVTPINDGQNGVNYDPSRKLKMAAAAAI